MVEETREEVGSSAHWGLFGDWVRKRKMKAAKGERASISLSVMDFIMNWQLAL